MRQRKWVSAVQLNRWADSNDSKSRLPELIRRLVHGTVEPADIEFLDFPAGEETHRPGYDGVTKIKRGNAKVPVGTTYWEMGTTGGIKVKIDKDYEKRIKGRGTGDFAEANYIWVTPRDYQDKKNWVDKKNRLKHWKEVRVYDSDDIEQWLEMSAAVALWLSPHVSNAPEGLLDLSSHWDNLQEGLRRKLPASALLVSRQRAIESFKEWLDGTPRVLTIYGHSPQEVVDVFVAWVESLSDAEQAPITSRAIIVGKADNWHELIDSEQRLILICAERLEVSEALIAEARRKGHHILVPVSSIGAQVGANLRLERMDRAALEKILSEAGLPEQEAFSLAQQSGGSFTVLKRRFSSLPLLTRPKWGESQEAHELAPLLLAGAWQDNFPADQEIISKITARPYTDAQRITNRWRSEADAPIRWINGVWEFISPLDAWTFLNPALSPNHLNAFEEAVQEVLGIDDPKFELPHEDRWLANIKGKHFVHSDELRQGLARTLALLATQEASAQITDIISLQARINRIVQKLLPEGAKWQRWASLGDVLPLIAEAAPEILLAAAESGLRGEKPELPNLFLQEKAGFMGQEEHSALLWALERLAWSPELLPRVSVVFAKLAEHDPGGQFANRPQSSLRDIFFSWMPHTAAPLEQRLEVLDLLVKLHLPIGWKLLLDLLPHVQESIMLHHTPEWRYWAEGWRRNISQTEYFRTVKALIQMATSTAINIPEKWIDLIGRLAFFPRDEYELVVDSLEKTSKSNLHDDLRKKLWLALCKEIQRFRYFSDAAWALSAPAIASLETIRNRLQPSDLVELAFPLFEREFDILRDKTLSWEQLVELRTKRRAEAILAILKSHGFDGVLRLARSVQDASAVGTALADVAGDEHDSKVLPTLLCCHEKFLEQFSGAYAAYRIRRAGRDWAESLPFMDWKTDEAIAFMLRMPFDKRTWDFIERLGKSIETEYWRQIEGMAFDLSGEEVELAAHKFISVGRPFSAIEFLAMISDQKIKPKPKALIDLLEMALEAPQEERNRPREIHYDIVTLLEQLQQDPEVDEKRLARLEWLLLPMIDSYQSLPVALYNWLAQDPEFFIELLTLIYRPHHADKKEPSQEKKETDESNRRQAERAWKLLRAWQRIPGTRKDGMVNAQQLHKWVKSARDEAAKVDRLEVCDITLGELFAHAPIERDGSWPCIPVREIIEMAESPNLENGFRTGIVNKRGIVGKALGEGGQQERSLAEKYDAYARACQTSYPHTASVLRSVAANYLDEARREDAKAEALK